MRSAAGRRRSISMRLRRGILCTRYRARTAPLMGDAFHACSLPHHASQHVVHVYLGPLCLPSHHARAEASSSLSCWPHIRNLLRTHPARMPARARTCTRMQLRRVAGPIRRTPPRGGAGEADEACRVRRAERRTGAARAPRFGGILRSDAVPTVVGWDTTGARAANYALFDAVLGRAGPACRRIADV